jgi:hypothetical protein
VKNEQEQKAPERKDEQRARDEGELPEVNHKSNGYVPE